MEQILDHKLNRNFPVTHKTLTKWQRFISSPYSTSKANICVGICIIRTAILTNEEGNT